MSMGRAVVLVCVLAGAALAETPQQQADKLFAEGRELLTAKNDPKAACERFEAAIRLDPTATGTMLNLGLCYEKLDRIATSIAWFRKAANAAAEAHLDEYEAAAKEHMDKLKPRVPSIRIEVSPPDAEVRIDGERVSPTDYGKKEIDPRIEHEITARAPGMRKVTEKVTIAEGETRTVSLSVTEAAVPVYVDKGKGRRRGGLILAGVGVGALIFTGVYGLVQRDKFFDDSLTMAEQDKAKDNLRIFGTTTFIVGLATATTGAILYFTAPRREQVSDGTAFAPLITNDQIGLAASGRF
ncbi:MAG: hypothetical protein JNL83_25670 [Myxococcales bacterium]|nr:hypothetical protein [Myxococcales bacterium]